MIPGRTGCLGLLLALLAGMGVWVYSESTFSNLDSQHQAQLLTLLPPVESLRLTTFPEILPTLAGSSDSEAAQALLSTPQYQECRWNWASEDQPDLTARLAALLDAAGIDHTSVRVYAYGENCFDAQGNVAYFAAMETDFAITLPVADVGDREAVGTLAAAVLAIIPREFPVETTPGPQPGRVELRFEAGSEAVFTLIVREEVFEPLIQQGVSGAALLDALGRY